MFAQEEILAFSSSSIALLFINNVNNKN